MPAESAWIAHNNLHPLTGNSQVIHLHVQLRHKAPPRSMIQLNREVIPQSAAGLPRRKRLCCGAGTEHNECPSRVKTGLSRPTTATSALGGEADIRGTTQSEAVSLKGGGRVSSPGEPPPPSCWSPHKSIDAIFDSLLPWPRSACTVMLW